MRDAGIPLAEALDRRTVEAVLARPEKEKVRCFACGHRCLIAKGRRGICKVRSNRDGKLRVPFGYVAGLQADPVEKKPFFHVLPGSIALTFGMLGCDYRCVYCQNWMTSQALRDPAATASFREIEADEIAALAKRRGARLVVSSYNEPLITAEWGAAVFDAARREGLPGAIVSNGNGTPEALDFLGPRLVACKIDLKGFHSARYRELGGNLDRVMETIREVHVRGIWLELVTLLVPGFNDDPSELRDLAGFIASVSRDIPWHVTAFHRDYRLTDGRDTVPEDLLRAAAIGSAAGLRFVYAGNQPGRVDDLEDTRCPSCQKILIRRRGYSVSAEGMKEDGCCAGCGREIPGRWRA
ncbi:MAG: AmmeMemoRadiSam system radical SAM enzyme [Verrucomicrobiae bacterium]|nr:AmmeMemoRadiSam system radical SAM enzyme [Verrucomicrobiae bacterium]